MLLVHHTHHSQVQKIYATKSIVVDQSGLCVWVVVWSGKCCCEWELQAVDKTARHVQLHQEIYPKPPQIAPARSGDGRNRASNTGRRWAWDRGRDCKAAWVVVLCTTLWLFHSIAVAALQLLLWSGTHYFKKWGLLKRITSSGMTITDLLACSSVLSRVKPC